MLKYTIKVQKYIYNSSAICSMELLYLKPLQLQQQSKLASSRWFVLQYKDHHQSAWTAVLADAAAAEGIFIKDDDDDVDNRV